MRTISTVTNPSGVDTEREIVTRVPAYANEHTPDRATGAIQNAIAQATAAARSLVPEGEVLFQDVAFTSTVNVTLGHKLGRAYRDWSVSRMRNAYAVITEVAQNDTTLDERQITLVANLTCIANIRVR